MVGRAEETRCSKHKNAEEFLGDGKYHCKVYSRVDEKGDRTVSFIFGIMPNMVGWAKPQTGRTRHLNNSRQWKRPTHQTLPKHPKWGPTKDWSSCLASSEQRKSATTGNESRSKSVKCRMVTTCVRPLKAIFLKGQKVLMKRNERNLIPTNASQDASFSLWRNLVTFQKDCPLMDGKRNVEYHFKNKHFIEPLQETNNVMSKDNACGSSGPISLYHISSFLSSCQRNCTGPYGCKRDFEGVKRVKWEVTQKEKVSGKSGFSTWYWETLIFSSWVNIFRRVTCYQCRCNKRKHTRHVRSRGNITMAVSPVKTIENHMVALKTGVCEWSLWRGSFESGSPIIGRGDE